MVRLGQAGVPIKRSEVGRTRPGGGSVGQGSKGLPQDIKDEIDLKWKQEFWPITGYETYRELLEAESLLKQPHQPMQYFPIEPTDTSDSADDSFSE